MTGVRKKITIEATGGHHELGVLINHVQKAVESLRAHAEREEINYVTTTAPRYRTASINLEGTIRIETEDDL